MSIIKQMAMNLVRFAPGKDSMKARRKADVWDQGYLQALIT